MKTKIKTCPIGECNPALYGGVMCLSCEHRASNPTPAQSRAYIKRISSDVAKTITGTCPVITPMIESTMTCSTAHYSDQHATRQDYLDANADHASALRDNQRRDEKPMTCSTAHYWDEHDAAVKNRDRKIAATGKRPSEWTDSDRTLTCSTSHHREATDGDHESMPYYCDRHDTLYAACCPICLWQLKRPIAVRPTRSVNRDKIAGATADGITLFECSLHGGVYQHGKRCYRCEPMTQDQHARRYGIARPIMSGDNNGLTRIE